MPLNQLKTVDLSYTKHGEHGPTLIILHGLFGSARNWQGIARQLADRFSVYALDLRNHGGSEHADTMDYPQMAADVLGFMQQQNLSDVILLGHSMGGKVAMQLALSYPDTVRQLVVVDIAPVHYQHNFDEVLAGLYHVPLDSVDSRKQADQYLAEKITTVSLRQFLLQNLVTNTAGGYQWRVNLASIEESMPVIMGFPSHTAGGFVNPTLFINGATSSYLAKRHRAIASQVFPQALFETVANAGHWPHVESPVEFMEYLNGFLTSK